MSARNTQIYHLPAKQKCLLEKMYKDFGCDPIDLTMIELGDKYNIAPDTARRLILFLKRYNIVTQFKLGYRIINCLQKDVEVYLQNPRAWTLARCKEAAWQTLQK